jgi:hypothetical protein
MGCAIAELTCLGDEVIGVAFAVYTSDSRYAFLRLLEEEHPASKMASGMN